MKPLLCSSFDTSIRTNHHLSMISLSEHWNAFINTTQDQTLMFTTSKQEPATKNSQENKSKKSYQRKQDNQFIQEKNETHFLLKQENYLHELLVLVNSPITIILVTQLCPIYYLKNKVIVNVSRSSLRKAFKGCWELLPRYNYSIVFL